MIPLENQVCTLKQAIILKDEFGLELESYFAFFRQEKQTQWQIGHLIDVRYYLKESLISEYYPAPNCAESGVLLPGDLGKCSLNIWKSNKIYISCYNSKDFKNPVLNDIHQSKYEAHAKPDLLIHLLRKGYIKPEDLKL